LTIMTIPRVTGLVMVILGVILVVGGLIGAHTLVQSQRSMFGGGLTKQTTLCIIGGIICALGGIPFVLGIVGRRV
jgi:hypothetical protein